MTAHSPVSSENREEWRRRFIEGREDIKHWSKFKSIAVDGIVPAFQARLDNNLTRFILLQVLERTIRSAEVICFLRENFSGNFSVEGGIILRSMYDATLQMQYLTHEDEKIKQRTREYALFNVIEKNKRYQQLKSVPLTGGQELHSDPRIREILEEIASHIDEANKTFKRDNGKYHQNWYKKSLPQLAEDVRLKPEYDLVMQELHYLVHASPTSIAQETPMKIEFFLIFSERFIARQIRSCCKVFGVKLGRDAEHMIDDACKPFVFE